MSVVRTCTACGCELEPAGTKWVDARSGDEGGTYDICPARYDEKYEGTPMFRQLGHVVSPLAEPKRESVHDVADLAQRQARALAAQSDAGSLMREPAWAAGFLTGATWNHARLNPEITDVQARRDRAEAIADEVTTKRSIGGYSGIQDNTRKIARAVALEAARVALGLPAHEPFHPTD